MNSPAFDQQSEIIGKVHSCILSQPSIEKTEVETKKINQSRSLITSDCRSVRDKKQSEQLEL